MNAYRPQMPGLLCCIMLLGTASVHGQVQAPGANAASDFEQGVSIDLYDADESWTALPILVPGQTPNVSVRRAGFDIAADGIEGFYETYYLEARTFLRIDEPGVYQFLLTSDDGSRLLIDERVVVDHDFNHGMVPKVGAARLEAGAHSVLVQMFQGGGPQGLSLQWKPPGAQRFTAIPAERLQTEAGLTRVVAPGPKRFSTDGTLPRPGDGRPLEALHPMWKLTTIIPVADVPEEFQLQVAGMAYLGGGRLAITAFDPYFRGERPTDPDGSLWMLDGVDRPADTFYDTTINLDAADPPPGPDGNALVDEQRRLEELARAKRTLTLSRTAEPNAIAVPVHLAADGFIHPLGTLAHGDALYVAQRDEVTKLTDPDGDGFYDRHTTIATGWKSDNYHHFTFGPVFHDGYLYATLSVGVGLHAQTITRPDTFGTFPNPPHRGSLVKIDPDSDDPTAVQYIAGGLRTPNGLFVHDGELFVGENQGHWMPSNKINHLRPGHFYGYFGGNLVSSLYPDGGTPTDFSDQPLTPPAVHLPQNEIANSPTDAVTLTEGPFAGQLLVSDVKQGGLRRVAFEKVHDEYQGVAFRHSQGFIVGLNRLALGDNGSLYVGGIGERRSWSWKHTQQGLQRLDPTGVSVFEFLTVNATTDGLTLRFTEPVAEGQLEEAARFTVQQWNYRSTGEYGGPKLNLEQLPVTITDVAADRTSVTLALTGMKADRVIHIRADLASAAGAPIWSPEAWYTMNQIPGRAAVVPDTQPVRVLIFTETKGFRHASIEPGVKALKLALRQTAIDVVHVDDSAIDIFNDDELARFDAVVFLNTTGDVLDDNEQAAFEKFIRNGGGFVGIHSATDTEYDWPWYTDLVGAQFNGHPKVQPATIRVVDATRSSTTHLPNPWQRIDEWYNFKKVNADLNVLLELDPESYEGSTMGGVHPIAWWHEYDGGRAWYTGGGHTDASYSDPAFMTHLLGGIRWATGLND